MNAARLLSDRTPRLTWAHQCARRLVMVLLVGACCSSAVSAQPTPPTPAEALQRLKDGNHRFVQHKLNPNFNKERRIDLAEGQQPFATIIACADSRVAPELIFDKGLGDLFVLRVAGNVVVESHGIVGSAEYAIAVLKVPLVMVIGHEDCGAVKAAMKGDFGPGNLGRLLKGVHLGADLPKDKQAALAAATRANANYQAEHLLSESEMMRDCVASGRILIVPAVYSLKTGEVTFLDAVTGKAKKTKPD
jgi:carbonic anhydrase